MRSFTTAFEAALGRSHAIRFGYWLFVLVAVVDLGALLFGLDLVGLAFKHALKTTLAMTVGYGGFMSWWMWKIFRETGNRLVLVSLVVVALFFGVSCVSAFMLMRG